jgi:ubiquinone/menaquinone biosynthesis C-methylase UbiE
MFMPDPVKALNAFLRVLKPGGKASVTVWGSPDKSPVMAAVMNIVSAHLPEMKQSSPGTPGGAFSISTVDMLHDYFLKAGFSNFNAEKIEVTVAQTDTAEQFWQAMTEVTGFLVILYLNCLKRRSWQLIMMLSILFIKYFHLVAP